LRDLSGWRFVKPEKEITNLLKLETFLSSDMYAQYESFLSRTSKAIVGKKICDVKRVSEFLHRVLAMLDEMQSWLTDFPPIQQPMRYGNKAFRDYGARLAERAVELMDKLFFW